MTASSEAQQSTLAPLRDRAWLWALLISLSVSLLIVLPFFWMGNATGHDFQFHAASWFDAAGQWKHGILYPRWTEWANYGLGEPRFIFYPPLSWMLGAALGMLGAWNRVPIVFVTLTQTSAGVAAFALARRLISRRASFFCAACYAANPYALLNVYMRSDFAELLADAFYPLLFLFLFKICDYLETGQERKAKPSRPPIVAFAAVYAAIWLSNAPAAVIASYSAAAMFGYAALTRRSWLPLWRGAAGLTLGLVGSAFYLLPAAYEQRWVNIGQALSAGLLPSENFLYASTNDPEHTLFNWTASTLAVVMITLVGLSAIVVRRTDASRGGALQSEIWRVLMLAAGIATLLMLRFSSIFWALLPKLRFVQFPWRWMSLLAVPFAVFLACTMNRKRRGWLCVTGVFALIGATGIVLVERGWWDTEDIPVLREAIANGQGFEGTDEYDPAGDDHTNILTKSPEVQVMDTDTMQGPVRKPVVRIERWNPEEKVVLVNAPLPFYLGIRVLNYPAWRAEVNGAKVTPRGGEDYDEMMLAIPAGQSKVTVRFVRTWDRALGGIVSLTTLLMVAYLRIRQKSTLP